MIEKRISSMLLFAIVAASNLMAQPVLETGGKKCRMNG